MPKLKPKLNAMLKCPNVYPWPHHFSLLGDWLTSRSSTRRVTSKAVAYEGVRLGHHNTSIGTAVVDCVLVDIPGLIVKGAHLLRHIAIGGLQEGVEERTLLSAVGVDVVGVLSAGLSTTLDLELSVVPPLHTSESVVTVAVERGINGKVTGNVASLSAGGRSVARVSHEEGVLDIGV